jgi:cytochrome P450
VEELLRYDSPVQFSRRIALETIEIGGFTIEPGELVMTGLGAANHDPAKFGPTADDLDLGRPDAREHVSFGSGVHHCLGAALARLEGQEAIGRVVRRFPAIEAAGEPTHNGRIVLRGFDELPVSLG